MENEKRLIDANALLAKMRRTSRYFAIKFDIEEAPTVDAVPVVHGQWKKQVEDGMYWYVCSECGGEVPKTRYCGAKMDGERKDNEC